ncbi:unnamed protein product [Pleuronectes platessa]|uniref:Uncharacterized protein n=1 Tax=Pleuronectes platessa TaxID=8262 RepID=A0A9N7TW98_PLEPL|nr:unnamed protein product [Pleuronectes platessa]
MLFEDSEKFEASLHMQVMNIAIIGDKQLIPGSDQKSATIVVEGAKILVGKDMPSCCALLMRTIYALNLSYRNKVKSTFEVFQKLFLGLDGLRTSAKVTNLKNAIF